MDSLRKTRLKNNVSKPLPSYFLKPNLKYHKFVLVGYARVSTQDQHLGLQRDALEKAGGEKFFSDIASGAKTERDGFERALEFVRPGDTLVVWKLDRLGRSLKDLVEKINALQAQVLAFGICRKALTPQPRMECCPFIFLELLLNLNAS